MKKSYRVRRTAYGEKPKTSFYDVRRTAYAVLIIL